MKVLKILFKGLLIVYSILTILAVIADLGVNPFNLAHLFFLIGSAILIAVVFIKSPHSLVLLIVGLVCLHIAAIIAGQITGFHLSHHLVRAAVSLILVLMCLRIRSQQQSN